MSLPTRLNRVNLSNDGTNFGFVESAATSHDLELNAPNGSNIVAKNPLYYLNSSSASTSLNTTLDGLQTSLDSKQSTISDGDLAISHVSGLEDALNEKLTLDDVVADITDGSEEPVRAGAVYTALQGKQNTIGADDLAISDTAGLQAVLDGKLEASDIAGKADTSVTDDLETRLQAVEALFALINSSTPGV
jgi:hypothetical protein